DGERFHPAGSILLEEIPAVDPDVLEAVVAAGVGQGVDLHPPERVADVDVPTGNAGLARILHAVAVRVVELLALDRREMPVPEVCGNGRTAGQHDRSRV